MNLYSSYLNFYTVSIPSEHELIPLFRVCGITLLLSLRIPPSWDEAIPTLFNNNFEIASLDYSLAILILTCATFPEAWGLCKKYLLSILEKAIHLYDEPIFLIRIFYSSKFYKDQKPFPVSQNRGQLLLLPGS